MLPSRKKLQTSSALSLVIIVISVTAVIAAPAPENDVKAQLSGSELEKFEQFKAKIMDKLPEDYMKNDFYLLRWIQAKEFNVDEAEAMISENLKWREENNMANILSEDFSDVSQAFEIRTDTKDKMGRPIGTAQLGNWDIRKGADEDKLMAILRYIESVQETLVRQVMDARKNGKNVETAILLADMDKFNKTKLMCSDCTPVLMGLIDGLESHYPGFIGDVILINAPNSFSRMMGAAAGLLSKRTKEAIKMFTKKEEWMAYLDETIDKEERYVNFGGTKEYKK